MKMCDEAYKTLHMYIQYVIVFINGPCSWKTLSLRTAQLIQCW